MSPTNDSTHSSNRAQRREVARRSGVLGATGVLAVGSAGALLAAFAGSAGAATTILVDSSADGVANSAHCTDGTPGNCTLRDAAALAADGDTINFSVSNVTLTNGKVSLGAVNIIGAGSTALTVTTTGASGAYSAFYISGTGDVLISGITVTKNRIFAENVGSLTLNDVSITGSSGTYGGALYAAGAGALVISNSSFAGNTSTKTGGAIYASKKGAVTISNSSITGNTAGGGGGGIYTSSGSGEININDSTFDGNVSNDTYAGGGGANINGTNVAINRSTFSNNTTERYGGGFYISSEVGDVVINDSAISGNTANGDGGGGACLYGGGNVTVARTSVTGNRTETGAGGGLWFGSKTDTNTITDSLISGNTASLGGGVYFKAGAGSVSFLNNSTLTGNYSYAGGGLITFNPMTINQSTITQNTAFISGGMVVYSSLNLSGAIVSGNLGATFIDIGSDGSSITSNHSILGDVDPDVTIVGSNNIMTTDPMVSALADHGGPTLTMALLPGSPAIDAGPNPVASFVGNEFDQRGAPWVRVYNGTADIGAFELQPDPTPAPNPEPVIPAFTG